MARKRENYYYLPISPDDAAALIRAILSARRINQKKYAKERGFNRVVFNMYLNRHLDLLPEDIDSILTDLGIKHLAERTEEVVQIITE